MKESPIFVKFELDHQISFILWIFAPLTRMLFYNRLKWFTYWCAKLCQALHLILSFQDPHLSNEHSLQLLSTDLYLLPSHCFISLYFCGKKITYFDLFLCVLPHLQILGMLAQYLTCFQRQELVQLWPKQIQLEKNDISNSKYN